MRRPFQLDLAVTGGCELHVGLSAERYRTFCLAVITGLYNKAIFHLSTTLLHTKWLDDLVYGQNAIADRGNTGLSHNAFIIVAKGPRTKNLKESTELLLDIK